MTTSVTIDARGLRCPINWAKTKAALENLALGTLVEVLVDDPRSERDLPAAAEAAGHIVVSVELTSHGYRILLEK
jgi:TusA-related sulfurtransferase